MPDILYEQNLSKHIIKANIPTEPIQFTAKRSPNTKDGRTAEEIRKLIDR